MLATNGRITAHQPTYRPHLTLPIVGKSSLDTRITFSRASSDTYVAPSGTMVTASAASPRFDHLASPLEPRGLLVEGSRTNLALRSNTFSDAVWIKSLGSVTADVTLSPDGIANAAKLVEDSSSGIHNVSQSLSSTLSTVYTLSVYARAAGRAFLQIFFSATGFGTTQYANFNLSNGTLGTVGAATTATIIPHKDGWYRCSITCTATATAASGYGFSTIASATAARNATHTGDGASGLLFYGAQCESGSFASSYIATAGASATRSTDAAALATLTPWFNASAGTVLAEFSVAGVSSTQTVLSLDNGTTNERITLRASVGTLGLFINDGGVAQGTLTSSALTAGTIYRAAFRYALNDFALCVNRGSVVTDTSGTLPTVTQLALGGRASGTEPLFGWLRRVQYWPYAMPNGMLQSIT
jgi:hypothetical protein